MTIQYLASASPPTAFFGDRYLTLGDPNTQRILGMFGSVLSTGVAAAMGINGQPGQIYSVPAGKQFIAYQWKFNGAINWNGVAPQIRVELGRTIDGDFSALAAINADLVQLGPQLEGGTFADLLNETNAIAVLFDENEIPQVRAQAASGSLASMYNGSVEVYGIESDKGTPV